ncbi:MAG: hypothetical protein ACRDZ3_08475 [Acidimicrobiia bacterium]
MRRLIQFGLLGLLVAALSGPATPSSALEQAQGLTVAENQTVAQEYQPIATFNPAPDNAATGSSITPDVCRTATWCDVVPLEVVTPPGLGPEAEFFVRVKLEWETSNIPGNPLMEGQRTVNDLDLYAWDDPQGEFELAAGGTEQEPEELSLFRPTKGRYQLVVANYLGPNTGYRITATYKPEPIIPPFESLEPVFELPPLPSEAPVFEPPAEDPEPEEAEAPPDFSGVPLETPPAPVVDPTPAPSLEPVAVEADPDFEDFDDSEFTDALAAPVRNDVLQERKARSVGPPEPASAPMVVLWMAVLPLALFGGAGFWLARRGSGVLRVK